MPRITALLGTLADHVGTLCLLLLPFLLLYSRVGAEIAIGIIDGCLLIRSACAWNWGWLRQVCWLACLPYWGWLILCSLLHGRHGSPVQAMLAGRFFLLLPALAEWLLLRPDRRRWIGTLLMVTGGWIMLQCWQQYLFGVNVFGHPRWGDGALTGPFNRPRAGPAAVLVFFPAVLPLLMGLLGHGRPTPRWTRRAAGVLLIGAAATTMVLIGQRMPALLTLLGLLVTGLILPRLRGPVLVALVAGGVLLAATPVISPPTFNKLYVHFLDQMRHFSRSAYGEIYGRAIEMTRTHPLTGLGFDGFRNGCAQPRYFVATLPGAAADGGAIEGCNIHPHNYYLEAATSAGLPGLLLFCAMVLSWLVTLGRDLAARQDPVRVAGFVAVLIALWPIASTSEFYSLPNAGWLFLILGWGLAAGSVPVPQAASSSSTRNWSSASS